MNTLLVFLVFFILILCAAIAVYFVLMIDAIFWKCEKRAKKKWEK